MKMMECTVDCHEMINAMLIMFPLYISLNRYIDYCLHRINLLRHHGVQPVLVFDGACLPMKSDEEIKRARYVILSPVAGELVSYLTIWTVINDVIWLLKQYKQEGSEFLSNKRTQVSKQHFVDNTAKNVHVVDKFANVFHAIFVILSNESIS